MQTKVEVTPAVETKPVTQTAKLTKSGKVRAKKEVRIRRGHKSLTKIFLEQMADEHKIQSAREYAAMLSEMDKKCGLAEDADKNWSMTCTRFKIKASGQAQLIGASRSVFMREDAQKDSSFLRAFVELCQKHIGADDIVEKVSIKKEVPGNGELLSVE